LQALLQKDALIWCMDSWKSENKNMKSDSKNLLRIIGSIIAGLVGAGITFFGLIIFFFYAGLFGWSDGGEEKFLRRLEISTKITLVISIAAALFVGTLIIVKMNKTTVKEKDPSLSDKP
jgi:hypothetical protein